MQVILADDDPDDRMLALRAFEHSRLPNEVHCVEDGDQLMQYLLRQGAHTDAQHPDVVLLDVNMPRKSGLEALKEIKSHTVLKRIPVVMLTTS